MIVFLRKGYEETGSGRYAECLGDVTVIEKVVESNTQSGKSAIFVGFSPNDLWLNKTFENKYYVFASPLGQAFSSPDFNEVRTLDQLIKAIDKGIITNAIVLSQALADAYGFIFVQPYLNVEKMGRFDPAIKSGISLFGNKFRPHKNLLNEIRAAKELQKSINQPILFNVDHHSIVNFLEQLNEKVLQIEYKIISGLYDRQKLYDQMASHSIHIECSFSESFSYMVLENALLGVPSIIGPNMYWFGDYVSRVSNIDDWREIHNAAACMMAYDRNVVSQTAFQDNELWQAESIKTVSIL
mgnify:FL=1